MNSHTHTPHPPHPPHSHTPAYTPCSRYDRLRCFVRIACERAFVCLCQLSYTGKIGNCCAHYPLPFQVISYFSFTGLFSASSVQGYFFLPCTRCDVRYTFAALKTGYTHKTRNGTNDTHSHSLTHREREREIREKERERAGNMES